MHSSSENTRCGLPLQHSVGPLRRACLLQPRTFLELGSRLVALPDLPEVTKNVWSKKL